MNYQCKKWFYGLASGFIGGGAGSAASTMAACVIAPSAFNLSSEIGQTMRFATIMFAFQGVATSFLFLRQSPLPPMESDTEFTRRYTKQKELEQAELGAAPPLPSNFLASQAK